MMVDRLFENGECKTEDWQNIRVLAPKAELRIRICGGSSSIERNRLSYLGKALRALLLTEMRNLEVISIKLHFFTFLNYLIKFKNIISYVKYRLMNILYHTCPVAVSPSDVC